MKKKRFLVYFYLGFNSSVAIRTHPNIESHKFSPFLFFSHRVAVRSILDAVTILVEVKKKPLTKLSSW
jgi:hypothetical protein